MSKDQLKKFLDLNVVHIRGFTNKFSFFFRVNNPKKRKRSNAWHLSTKHGNSESQYQIDAGQKMFGATKCKECGIIYHLGDEDDENAHLNYHNSLKILKFHVHNIFTM